MRVVELLAPSSARVRPDRSRHRVTVFDPRQAQAPVSRVGGAVIVVAMLALVVVSGPRPVRDSGANASAHASARLAAVGSLSLQGQALISTSVASDDAAFAAERSPRGFRLAGGALRAAVRSGGVSISAGGEVLTMLLTGIGRIGRLEAPGSAVDSARRNRVIVSYPGIVEWYAAGPVGIEQGFTISRRPTEGTGSLTLALRWTDAYVPCEPDHRSGFSRPLVRSASVTADWPHLTPKAGGCPR